MFTKLRLTRFKNFDQAELTLGAFTTLIGSNAAGKSNLRDAFRFLHGIGRGYKLAEIIGERYGEGGVLQWRGIRGGARELTYLHADTFAIQIELSIYEAHRSQPWEPINVVYTIKIDPGKQGEAPRIVEESLVADGQMIFAVQPAETSLSGRREQNLWVRAQFPGKEGAFFGTSQPVLTQSLIETVSDGRDDGFPGIVKATTMALGAMRFFEFSPEAMRNPSLPGQITLGDRGENLSSVLQAICAEPQRKQALIEWLRELTPMDVQDFAFVEDAAGRILVYLVEEQGRMTSAYSASDGTLRFLALLAALLIPAVEQTSTQPAQPRFYFFEELENGLHPARLHLLLQLAEQETNKGSLQIIGTTHSPQLLQYLSPSSTASAALIYRLPMETASQIRPVLALPNVQQLLHRQGLARLHETGWFEDAAYLLNGTTTTEMMAAS